MALFLLRALLLGYATFCYSKNILILVTKFVYTGTVLIIHVSTLLYE